MLLRRNLLKLVPLAAGFFAMEMFTPGNEAIAQATGAPEYTLQSPKVAAGVVDVEQLLLLMDADKNGKISRKEFMDFMAAEFDRLDIDKNGELDIKELKQSALTASHHGGTHR